MDPWTYQFSSAMPPQFLCEVQAASAAARVVSERSAGNVLEQSLPSMRCQLVDSQTPAWQASLPELPAAATQGLPSARLEQSAAPLGAAHLQLPQLRV